MKSVSQKRSAYKEFPTIYRVSHLVLHLGWADFGLGYSTTCQIMPGLWGIWQKWLGSWATWWSIQINVNPTQVHDQMRHPVLEYHCSGNHIESDPRTVDIEEVAKVPAQWSAWSAVRGCRYNCIEGSKGVAVHRDPIQ